MLNKTPSIIGELLSFTSLSRHSYYTRFQSALHDKQLWDPAEGLCTEVFRRSIFGYIGIYNRLPQHIINLRSVKLFQMKLQETIRELTVTCSAADLSSFLCPRNRVTNITRFQRCFDV